MPWLELPRSDALAGGGGPFAGFGPCRREHPGDLHPIAEDARRHLREVFGRDVAADRSGVTALEAVIQDLWRSGWVPEAGFVSQLTRDLGALLLLAIHGALGGECYLRSPTDLSHASLWWRDGDFEVFPFHVVHRALLREEPGAIAGLVERLALRAGAAPGGAPPPGAASLSAAARRS